MRFLESKLRLIRSLRWSTARFPRMEMSMHLTVAHFLQMVGPLGALLAGILILIIPRCLNYIVAIYLILVGLFGLNGIYHFIK